MRGEVEQTVLPESHRWLVFPPGLTTLDSGLAMMYSGCVCPVLPSHTRPDSVKSPRWDVRHCGGW